MEVQSFGLLVTVTFRWFIDWCLQYGTVTARWIIEWVIDYDSRAMTNFLEVNSYFQAVVEFERNHILLEMIPISRIVFVAILAFHFWLSQTIDLKISIYFQKIHHRIPTVKLKIPVKSMVKSRIPNFFYIQVIVFYLGYLSVAAFGT